MEVTSAFVRELNLSQAAYLASSPMVDTDRRVSGRRADSDWLGATGRTFATTRPHVARAPSRASEVQSLLPKTGLRANSTGAAKRTPAARRHLVVIERACCTTALGPAVTFQEVELRMLWARA